MTEAFKLASDIQVDIAMIASDLKRKGISTDLFEGLIPLVLVVYNLAYREGVEAALDKVYQK